MRKLTGYAAAVLGVVAIVMSLYHVYARLTPAAPDTLVLRIIVLAFCLTLAFLLFPFRATTPLDEESTRLNPEGGFAPLPDLPQAGRRQSRRSNRQLAIAPRRLRNRAPT